MAMTTGSPAARASSRFKRRPLADINVTPMVDVMLVLLVIFMVTAPMMTVGVPVDLPKTQAKSLHEKVEPLTITVTQEGKIYIQETDTDLSTLVPKLQAITQAKKDTSIYVRGDQKVSYGLILEVMGAITAAGFDKVALVAALPQPTRPHTQASLKSISSKTVDVKKVP